MIYMQAPPSLINNKMDLIRPVAAQGAFSIMGKMEPGTKKIYGFVPAVINISNVAWRYNSSFSEPRDSVMDVTQRWQGIYSNFVGIPDDSVRDVSESQLVFQNAVDSRTSFRRFGMHKVNLMCDFEVDFGDLALLGPASHAPSVEKMTKVDEDNPMVTVYPVKKRTLWYARDDECKKFAKLNYKADGAGNFDDSLQPLIDMCMEYCPWTLIPALAMVYFAGEKERTQAQLQNDYKAGAIPLTTVKVYQGALEKELDLVKTMSAEEIAAAYQFMMTSQLIGEFHSPAQAKGYAEILLK